MRKCKWCNTEKDIAEFYKCKTNKDGIHSYCKDCVKLKAKKWMEDNEDRYRKKMNNRKSEARKDPNVQKYHKLKAKEQRESGYQKEWRENNKDKLFKYRKYREMNKTHEISKDEWFKCKEYFVNSCAYCGIPIENHYVIYKGEYKLTDFHKEHVEHEGSNDISNCVPSCKSCNSKKWKYEFLNWYTKDNDIFDEYRLIRILKWINGDYIIAKDIAN